MAYRDDEFGKLRSKVNALEERLEVFEALYKERGFTPKLGRKLVTGFFGFFLKLFTKVKDFFTHPGVIIPLAIVGFVIGLVTFVQYKNDSARQEMKAKEEAAEQAILDKCSSFCSTHGYSFHDKREEDLCFCTQEGSETPVFIIDMETSEHWIVSE